MKTNNTHIMKKLILTAFAALAIFGAASAQAAFILTGNEVWRDNQEADAQGIAYEFLSGKIVYAKFISSYSVNARTVRTVCGSPEANGLGKRLFDADDAFCKDPDAEDHFQVVYFTFDSEGLTWNQYTIILPNQVADSIGNKIFKIQMGNAITREPPKLLEVFNKSDTCKDDGPLIPRMRIKVICNGWSWKDLHEQYWGKEVPPELKALNGTGVKKPEQILPPNAEQVAEPITDNSVSTKPE